jgi:hypothetical protein
VRYSPQSGIAKTEVAWRPPGRRPRVYNIQVALAHPFAGELALVEYPAAAVVVRETDLAARELRDGHQVPMQDRTSV